MRKLFFFVLYVGEDRLNVNYERGCVTREIYYDVL